MKFPFVAAVFLLAAPPGLATENAEPEKAKPADAESSLRDSVGFDQGDSRAVTSSADDSSIVPRREECDDH